MINSQRGRNPDGHWTKRHRQPFHRSSKVRSSERRERKWLRTPNKAAASDEDPQICSQKCLFKVGLVKRRP